MTPRSPRDEFGIPHISARNERDLVLLQGYVHAQDRLFQMDVTRRQADGTLAELVGSAALGTDVQLRTFGLRHAAERSLPILSRGNQQRVERVCQWRECLCGAQSLAAGIPGARDHAGASRGIRRIRSPSSS